MSADRCLLALLLLPLLVVFAACREAEEEFDDGETAFASETATPSRAPTSSPTPTLLETPGPSLTYNDPDHGYSFDYPTDWQISDQPEPGSLILYSYDLEDVPPEEVGRPVPPDKLKVFFRVVEGVDKPLKEWLAESDTAPGQVPPELISEEDISLDGRPGLKRVTRSDKTAHVNYYVELSGGRIFAINAVPANSDEWPTFHDVVLESLRL